MQTPPNEPTVPVSPSRGARSGLKKTVSVVSDRYANPSPDLKGPPTAFRVHSPANEMLEESYGGYRLSSHTFAQPRSESAPGYKNKNLQYHGGDRPGSSPLVQPRQQRQKKVSLEPIPCAEKPRRRAQSEIPPWFTPDQQKQSSIPPSSRTSSEFPGNVATATDLVYEPLQYHHRDVEDSLKNARSRLSKLTVKSVYSDGPGRDLRNGTYGHNLQRPDSGFSSGSDLRGRTTSPQLSPDNEARAVSAHSRSPDMHRLSYADLFNVSYPQPGPSVEHLVNPQLREAVGSNAALLSKRKTLEMYRANITKTNDPDAQYHFAIFLVDAARDAHFEDEDESDAGSEKAPLPIQGELLKEAKRILQRLADKSHPFAQYYLADGLFSGLFNKGKADHDRAFPLFFAAAKHHHVEATYRTALCYEYGWGSRSDAEKAVQFYQTAASKNHPGAMLRLGRACLLGGMGLGRKYREGIRWMKRAAEAADQQYNSAPYELGLLHEEGYGDDIFKDQTYSAQLFTRSAELGHPDASYRMGEAYERGLLNCPRDPSLSVHFHSGAAQLGHPMAQMALCAWYLTGAPPVLEKDEDEAYEWAKRAAESGATKAQYTVGYFSEMGIGCRRDPLEANVWYVRAADQGDARAIRRLEAIRRATTDIDSKTAASPPGKKGKLTPSATGGNIVSGMSVLAL